MKVAVFNTKSYDKQFITEANQAVGHAITFFEVHLNRDTCKLAFGFEAVCAFVNDKLDRDTLTLMSQQGVRLIALRCAGFNNIDLQAAKELNLTVVRVPVYSPHGVAEHAVALMLALNRKIYKSYNRVHEGNFSLEGLLGFDMYNRTVGVIGTGRIGSIVAKIMTGFGAKVIAFDHYQSKECIAMGVEYVTLEEVYKRSDIISLHSPLTKESYHMINEQSIAQMKHGVMLINTSRGGLVDTRSVIKSLKTGKIGFVGLDVYEEEGDMFFQDLSAHILQDDVFARLLAFPNVVITGHQAFFTREALTNIANTTIGNITAFEKGKVPAENCVTLDLVK